MKAEDLHKKAAIVGIGEVRPSKTPEGRTGMELAMEAARLALEDAGLDPGDVDGLLISPPEEITGVMMVPSYFAEYMRIKPRYGNIVDLGGATGAGMVWRAAAAIASGLCETVLCFTGSAWDTQTLFTLMQNIRFSPEEEQFERPYGPMGMNHAYALAARRHMHEFGTTARQLAKVAADQRTNALANPHAIFYGKPLTVDDVLASRLVCDPLHLFEIVMPCSGAAALVVQGKKRAKQCPRGPVWLLGAGEAMSHSLITYAPSLTETPIARAAPAAFEMAEVKPKDVHLVSIYDCYTIMVILTLEDAGFCKKGQGGPFVEAHDLTYQGDFPVNTHGGQLSFGQPGLAGGMSHITEAVRQIRGEAGQRQLSRCDLAYVNGNGGAMSEECSLILGR